MKDYVFNNETNVKVKLAILVSLISALIVASIALANTVRDNEHFHTQVYNELTNINGVVDKHEERLNRQDVQYATIIAKLDNIEKKVDEVEKR